MRYRKKKKKKENINTAYIWSFLIHIQMSESILPYDMFSEQMCSKTILGGERVHEWSVYPKIKFGHHFPL